MQQSGTRRGNWHSQVRRTCGIKGGVCISASLAKACSVPAGVVRASPRKTAAGPAPLSLLLLYGAAPATCGPARR